MPYHEATEGFLSTIFGDVFYALAQLEQGDLYS